MDVFSEQLGFAEPMPDFSSRYPGRLESCLETPFGKFGRTYFYPGILKKAVALFYFCIKDHPFENGNKRFAVSAMLCFLALNDKWLTIDPTALYNVAKYVASSNDEPEIVIKATVKVFKNHLVTGDYMRNKEGEEGV